MTKVLALLVTVAALAIPAVASADTNPGGISYDTLYGVAADNAQCGTQAGSGSFAFFGHFGDRQNMSGGADGYQTGLNNSAVCGNR